MSFEVITTSDSINLHPLYNVHCYYILKQMNFFKKVLGIFPNLSQQLKEAKFSGTFFRVIRNNRNVVFRKCKISFEVQEDEYFICFQDQLDKEQQAYRFPIQKRMSLVTFVIRKQGKQFQCFEWQLQDNQHIGCYIVPQVSDKFKQSFCKAIHAVINDPLIKEPTDLCRQLTGIPHYKQQAQTASTLHTSNSQAMNRILIAEAQKEENKMVHPCTFSYIVDHTRQLKSSDSVFALKCLPKNRFQFQLINMAGFAYFRKELTPSLTYDVNLNQAYIRWLDLEDGYKIVQIGFDGRRDAVTSLKYNIMECLYEINTGKKIKDQISPEEVAYLSRLEDLPKANTNIVKTYQKEEQQISEINAKGFIYNNPDAKKGLEKYKAFCQGKINDYSVSALGSMLQTLKINEENQIKLTDKRVLLDNKRQEVNIRDLLFHDNDSKAMILGGDGKLYYEDLIKNKLIEQWVPSKSGIQYISPQHKMAQAGNFKTFKAISGNSIYEVDPRTLDGVCSAKSYSGNPRFNTMCVDERGRMAIGSQNGEIRLYKNEVGQKAMNKFSATGEAVIHLNSTKDGKWLLATFSTYLKLLPTETEDQKNMYDGTVTFVSRPDPIKLQIKLEDLVRYKISQLQLVGAKFDQNSSKVERYIVSGFDKYTVIWNLNDILRGNNKYVITETQGELIQADFKYNDPTSLIMTTTKGIVLKRNKTNK